MPVKLQAQERNNGKVGQDSDGLLGHPHVGIDLGRKVRDELQAPQILNPVLGDHEPSKMQKYAPNSMRY